MDLLKRERPTEFTARFPALTTDIWRVLRGGLKARSSDHGRFAVALVSQDDDDCFLTPNTERLNVFYVAGTGRQKFVHACILLFDDLDSARAAAAAHVPPDEAVYYRLSIDTTHPSEPQLKLDLVSFPQALHPEPEQETRYSSSRPVVLEDGDTLDIPF